MKIEVFIPYFNHEKYILQTIASVDNCSNRNLDIVIKIVNDGSNYKNLIKKLDSKFFNLNIQVNDSLNIGAFAQHLIAIEESEADILFFLNSDDTYHEKRIEYFVNALNELPHAWAYSDVNVINKNPQIVNHEEYINEILAHQRELKSTSRLFNHNHMISTGNLVLKNPKYYANIFSHFRLDNVHDWYMARNLAMIENPVYIPLKLYNYFIHNANTFSKNLVESHVEGKLLHFVEQQVIALAYFSLDDHQNINKIK
jgi:glycosyltransferase involved in cell wall biosynthesis